MVNKNRHKILKTLEKVYLNNQHNKNISETIKEISSSLSFNHLKQKTKISDINLQRQLTFLILSGDVTKLTNESIENKESVNYRLTEKGLKSYVSNFYLNENWYRKTAIWISIISPIIALSSTYYTYHNNKNNAEKIRNLENKIEILNKTISNKNQQK